MNLSKKTRWLCCIVFCFLTMMCCVTVYAAKNDTGQAVIGIAWRADTDSEFYTNVCQAIEAAGGRYVLLPQVTSSDLNYNSSGFLLEGVDETGALTESASQKLRTYSWKHSNASDATSQVSAVVFTGGEDISSSLFAVPQPWHGIEAGRDFNAERDTSDYLLMSYCLEQNIPVMGFCRGMQMLSVVSGASMIQDLPTYSHSKVSPTTMNIAMRRLHLMLTETMLPTPS